MFCVLFIYLFVYYLFIYYYYLLCVCFLFTLRELFVGSRINDAPFPKREVGGDAGGGRGGRGSYFCVSVELCGGFGGLALAYFVLL